MNSKTTVGTSWLIFREHLIIKCLLRCVSLLTNYSLTLLWTRKWNTCEGRSINTVSFLWAVCQKGWPELAFTFYSRVFLGCLFSKWSVKMIVNRACIDFILTFVTWAFFYNLSFQFYLSTYTTDSKRQVNYAVT